MDTVIKRIPTKGNDGKPNGEVLPVWNGSYSGYIPKQFYITTVLPGCSKGPHLHEKRKGVFVCIRGNAVIVTRTDGVYEAHPTGEKAGMNVVQVPAGVAALIVNVGDTEVIFVNLPSPAWTAEDPDECPVIDWDYQP